MKETSCNWTDRVSFTVFLCGKLKLFAGTYFCGSLEKSGQKRNNCVQHGSASKEIQDNQNWLTSHARASLRYGVTVGSLCHPKIYSDKLMLKCILNTLLTKNRILKNLMSHLSSEAIVFCHHFCLGPIVVVTHSDKVILLQILWVLSFWKIWF